MLDSARQAGHSVSTSSPIGARWYVVRTARFKERQSAEAIAALAITTYLPCETHWTMGGGKRGRVTAPLFRQYLFTKFDLEQDDWVRIRYTRFVDDILCSNEIPLRVPDREIEAIRTAEAAGAYDLTRRHPLDDPVFPIGSKARVLAGPFAGMIGEVRRATPRRRVEILFSMLGRVRIDRINLARC